MNKLGAKGEIMHMTTLSRFKVHCMEAKRACEQMQSVIEFEPNFVRVLDYIKSNPEEQSQFKAVFEEMLGDPSLGPWELIGFCMHDLRWPGIKEMAQARLLNATDFRIKSVMSDIISAYNADWPDVEMYDFYRKRRGNPTLSVSTEIG